YRVLILDQFLGGLTAPDIDVRPSLRRAARIAVARQRSPARVRLGIGNGTDLASRPSRRRVVLRDHRQDDGERRAILRDRNDGGRCIVRFARKLSDRTDKLDRQSQDRIATKELDPGIAWSGRALFVIANVGPGRRTNLEIGGLHLYAACASEAPLDDQ